MQKESGFTWKLGMFVIIALAIFVLTIYFVGKQTNLFGSTFRLKATFKTVSGLKVGNNVRFSGINVGTVDDIALITDTSVMVELVIKEEVMQFIKKDATASIGSDGLMGDKVLTISPGTMANKQVNDNDIIATRSSVEMEDLMSSVKTSVDNAGVITGQLAEFTFKMNNSNGVLSKFISDESFSNSLKGTLTNLEASTNEFAHFTANLNDGELGRALDTTMSNIQGATKGLNENMEAAKNNILLRGYFKKKKKAEEKKQADLKKQEDKKRKKAVSDSLKNIVNTKDSIIIKTK